MTSTPACDRIAPLTQPYELTIGPAEASKELRECLAKGADKAVILKDAAWGGRDPRSTAKALAAKLAELSAQVVFCGRVATDRDNILNFYYNSGYPDASMDVVATAAPGNDKMMDLKYVVQEGRRLFVTDVQVNGLVSTRSSLVNNRISLFPGLPLSLSGEMGPQARRVSRYTRAGPGAERSGGITR